MLHYINVHWGIFLYLFPKLFVQYFSSGWRNYLCKALIMHRVKGEASNKHAISVMQGDGMITYVQHSKMCVQKVTSQYNGNCC